MNKQFFSLVALAAIAGLAYAQAPAADYTERGVSSWYGNEFQGKPTASGEVFDTRLLTAAHPSLPFGTELLVTNTQNGRQIRVRVNDRGPFVAGRIIDLSQAAAEALDMIRTGTAPVLVEALTGAPTPAPAAAPAAPAEPGPPSVESGLPPAAAASGPPVAVPLENGKKYRLQVGSYRLTRNAAEAFERLKAAGFAPAYERHQDLYRVVLVGLAADEVVKMTEKLGGAGFADVLVRQER